jgi:hypothetical protein
MKSYKLLLLLALLGTIGAACSRRDTCGSAGEVAFVCGPGNSEDLVLVPETPWIIASGLAEGSGLYLLNSNSGEWRPLSIPSRQDRATYPDCPRPPAQADLQTHGLNIRAGTDGQSRLYVVGHGAREAIEAFNVDASGEQPVVSWTGCVLLPEGLAANSVASFADGSLVATVLLMPGATFADSVAKKPTGIVLKWSPGDSGFEQLGATALPGNNGIEVSADGQEIYVVSSGLQTIVAFSNANPATRLRSTRQLPMTPDNLHMGPNGQLLTAGMKNDVPECGGPPGPEHDLAALSSCPRGTIAIAVDPVTMQDRILVETPAIPAFSNATMVLPASGQFWFGTFSGDRIAHLPMR